MKKFLAMTDSQTNRGKKELRKFAYTGIEVKDLDESIRFYTEILGFKAIDRQHVEKTGGEFVLLKDESTGQVLELNYYPDHDPTKYRVGFALDHLGFEVDDVYAETLKLQKAGCRVALPPERRKLYEVSYLKDPNGIWIELFKPINIEQQKQIEEQNTAGVST